jgi:hypothetical protein
MFLWFAAASVAIVWLVFQSPAIDYRMIVLGSVLAVAEAPFGVGPLQTLTASVVLLAVVMLATVGRRLVRRRWLGLPIGTFLHLVLDCSWSNTRVFWWPVRGLRFPDDRAPVVARGLWSVVLELLGVLIASWLWTRFGLADARRRKRFVTTGQLDRAYMSGGPT